MNATIIGLFSLLTACTRTVSSPTVADGEAPRTAAATALADLPCAKRGPHMTLYPYDVGTTELRCGDKACGWVIATGPDVADSDWDEEVCLVMSSTDEEYAEFPLVHPHPDATNAVGQGYDSIWRDGCRDLDRLKAWCDSLNARESMTTKIIDIDYLGTLDAPDTDKMTSGGKYEASKTIHYWHPHEFPRQTWSCPDIRPSGVPSLVRRPTRGVGNETFDSFTGRCNGQDQVTYRTQDDDD